MGFNGTNVTSEIVRVIAKLGLLVNQKWKLLKKQKVEVIKDEKKCRCFLWNRSTYLQTSVAILKTLLAFSTADWESWKLKASAGICDEVNAPGHFDLSYRLSEWFESPIDESLEARDLRSRIWSSLILLPPDWRLTWRKKQVYLLKKR